MASPWVRLLPLSQGVESLQPALAKFTLKIATNFARPCPLPYANSAVRARRPAPGASLEGAPCLRPALEPHPSSV